MKRLFLIMILAVLTVTVLDRLMRGSYAESSSQEESRATSYPSTGTRAPTPRRRSTGRSLPPSPEVSCGQRCGVERWQIKTLSDDQRSEVDFTPVATTLEELTQIPRPADAAGYRRLAPVEMTTYQIDAYLGGVKSEGDGDFHLILFGLSDQRASMIAEIPDPNCSGSCASGLSSEFAQARAELEAILAEPNPNDAPIIVRVTGVGFFDRNHGQVGRAPNIIELHPVLKLERR